MSVKLMRLLVVGGTVALSAILIYFSFQYEMVLSFLLVAKILFVSFCSISFLLTIIDEILILLKKRKT